MTLIERLIAATPPPPTTSDADALLAAFEQVLAARQAIAESAQPETADRALLAELHAREAAWRSALSDARDAVAERRGNPAKLRAYAASL